ncbi:aspartate/glutamate racemase family protein [Streptomyces sp. NPDC056716]|uniref:aspartate/glutamate racemase family protein n=1 Tax=unclassified Streptomyces TaxID=2593676 RepID=UPI003673DAFE
MKLSVVVPITDEGFTEQVREEVAAWALPDTTIEVRRIERGPASIESAYDEAFAMPGIVTEAEAAARDGADGVFVTCFGDPGVHAAREALDIPVVGGFEPAVLTALSLGERVGVVTMLPNVVPTVHRMARLHGITERCRSVRAVGIPVLALHDQETLLGRLAGEAAEAVAAQEADVIVLGCTGMMGVAAALQTRLRRDGVPVPVVDPTGAALCWLENLVRLGVRHSRTTYFPPPAKERLH